MRYFLEIYRSSADMMNGKNKLGVLEIGQNKGVGGNDIGVYEFVGAAAGTDGGTWEWLTGSSGVEMHLTSNITKKKAAILMSRFWKNGVIPPNLPWFTYDVVIGNDIIHFDPTGNTRNLIWKGDDPYIGY
jgi:hypothetical protein